jgi:hypothetical protein
VLVTTVIPNMLTAQDASKVDAYRHVFYENSVETFTAAASSSPTYKEMSEEEQKTFVGKMATHATDCHMRALLLYSPALQDVAYESVSSGGTYADSRQALNIAIMQESLAGGEREAAVKEMVIAAVSAGEACMKDTSSIEF